MAVRLRSRVVNFRSNVRKVVRFFDRQDVAVVARQAAYVRGVARQSISTRKTTSRPGKPPSSPTGVFRNSIFFAVERRTRTAVIGPIRTKHFRVPRALEYGGVSKFFRRSRFGGFARSGYQRVRARPTMRPALRRAAQRGLFERALKEVYRRRRRP